MFSKLFCLQILCLQAGTLRCRKQFNLSVCGEQRLFFVFPMERVSKQEDLRFRLRVNVTFAVCSRKQIRSSN